MSQPNHGVSDVVPEDRLLVERLPDEHGPVVRCSGELTFDTAEGLQRELARLEPMGHPVVTVNLSGCTYVDVDGLMTLLRSYRRLHEAGRRMVLVAGGGTAARLLQVLGIDHILPVFPREDVAALALRGAGPREPGPTTWEEARAKTLQRWETIRQTLERDPEEALRLMTSMSALCERSEELFLERTIAADARCRFCPLFQALGGHQADIGCRSALDPIIDDVRGGRLQSARTRIAELVTTIEQMPAPERPEATGWSDERGDDQC